MLPAWQNHALSSFQAALAAANAAATAFAVFLFFLVIQNGQFHFGLLVFLFVYIVYFNFVFAHGFSFKTGVNQATDYNVFSHYQAA